MRKALLLFIVIGAFASCLKKDNVVNNYTTAGSVQPAFAVYGISDMLFVNDASYGNMLNLTVQYLDSVQENVTLSLAGMPPGITMDTTWINSGIPTFTTTLNLFDTNATGVTPGSYPVTLTATTASGKKKNYPFNLKVAAMPTGFLGKYNTCTTSCGGVVNYSDSIYVDASVPNKVWFANFANTGSAVYALISNPEILTVPSQTISGVTYSGNANLFLAGHSMGITIHRGTSSCSINMH